MSNPDAFLPIPGWPGYSVNRLGQVRSEYGVLSGDCKGRVRLRDKASKRQRMFYVGELMGLAGLLSSLGRSPAPAPQD